MKIKLPKPKFIKRRLHPGRLYKITSVNETVMSDVTGSLCRIVAQFPDSHLGGKLLAASVVITNGAYGGSEMYVQGTFRLHNPNPQTTCYCKAYAWPHRLGSGQCWGTHVAIPGSTGFCGSCGRPCHVTTLGPETVSDCCATEVYLDPELEEIYENA